MTDGQLAFETHPHAAGESTELGDLNLERADAAEARLLAAIAAMAQGRRCRCDRPLTEPDELLGDQCLKCGRTVG